MKLKYRYLLREVSGQWVAVAVGKDHADFNGMIKLNHSGAFLMGRLIDGEQTYDSLVEGMLERYDVNREQVETDVKGFLQILREGNILEP